MTSTATRATLCSILLAAVALLSSACAKETCNDCLTEKCTDLLEICDLETDCACAAVCLGEQGVPGVPECLSGCGLPDYPPAFALLEECVATTCPDSDECSTPDDYTPQNTTDCDNDRTDIGDGALADCGFDPVLAFDPEGEILQLESADGQVCVRIERHNDGPGELANTSWTLLNIRVGPLGEVVELSDPAEICWYSSHHNLIDWAHAWTGNRHYDLNLEGVPSQPKTYELHTFEQGLLDTADCPPTSEGTACVGDPIRLNPVEP